jgi:hypothetical protein
MEAHLIWTWLIIQEGSVAFCYHTSFKLCAYKRN